MPYYTYTQTTVDLIYGFAVIDEDGDFIEGPWDYEPDEKELHEAGLCLIYFDQNFIPILGIAISHQNMDTCTQIYESLGQRIESKPEWRNLLKDFCSKNNIFFQEPEWIIGQGCRTYRAHHDPDYGD